MASGKSGPLACPAAAHGQGRSNAEIAEELCISELTVKSHIGRIFVKLDLRDRAAAIVHAYDHGVVTPVYPA
jgi:DNA-binding NarL/FixJ family response regulator